MVIESCTNSVKCSNRKNEQISSNESIRISTDLSTQTIIEIINPLHTGVIMTKNILLFVHDLVLFKDLNS